MKVLYVVELSTNEWMLFVWDGTDAPPVTFTQEYVYSNLVAIGFNVLLDTHYGSSLKCRMHLGGKK